MPKDDAVAVVVFLLLAIVQSHAVLALFHFGRIRWLYGRAHGATQRAVILIVPVIVTLTVFVFWPEIAPWVPFGDSKSPSQGLGVGSLAAALVISVYVSRVRVRTSLTPSTPQSPSDA